jgi:hypothetical protein
VSDDPLAVVGDEAQPRRVWEEFLVRIAREVEKVMQHEMFTPPGGQTFIPREYIVYLSPDDDKEWRGEKRRGLEQGLFHVLSERARELAGQTVLATKSFAVELRVDATLAKGEFRVQAVWDESEQGHTMVMPRVAAEPATVPTSAPETQEVAENEVTQVRARPSALYKVEVWQNGLRQTVVPVFKEEITIGRGSQSLPVDLPIRGDAEVSRLHATLARDACRAFLDYGTRSKCNARQRTRNHARRTHPGQPG